MSEEVWDKLKAPPRKRIQFCAPTHFCQNADGSGYHIEGTNIPHDPDTHVDEVVWVYEDDWSPCDE